MPLGPRLYQEILEGRLVFATLQFSTTVVLTTTLVFTGPKVILGGPGRQKKGKMKYKYDF